jgi:hypothetical protein
MEIISGAYRTFYCITCKHVANISAPLFLDISHSQFHTIFPSLYELRMTKILPKTPQEMTNILLYL